MKEKIGEKEQGNTEKRENLKSKIILWNLKNFVNSDKISTLRYNFSMIKYLRYNFR